MTETAATLSNPEIPTITDLGTEQPKTDAEMTYLDKYNTNEAICQTIEEEVCLQIRHAKDLQYNCGTNKLTSTREGGI